MLRSLMILKRINKAAHTKGDQDTYPEIGILGKIPWHIFLDLPKCLVFVKSEWGTHIKESKQMLNKPNVSCDDVETHTLGTL